MENLQDLFEDTIKDLYNAEKQFLKGMAKLERAAENPDVRQAMQDHIMQTEGQVERLKQVAEICGFRPGGKMCRAAQGLIEEAVEHLEEGEPGPTLDAAIIACAQKNEHYEICSYGAALAWAKLLGNREVVQLLQETLEEEEDTDELLSRIAKQVNKMALAPQEPTNGSRRREKVGTR